MAPATIISSGSHTASKTWVSPQAKEREAFAKFRANCVHIAPHSPFVPATWSEWVEHRIWAKEDAQKKAARRLAAKRAHISAGAELMQPFGGRTFDDFRSPVLGLESIWLPANSRVSPPGRAHAPWPTIDELKYEGAYRSISGYCRFLPLPRVPGNETAHWKRRSPLTPFPFDRVGAPMGLDGPSAIVGETLVFLLGGELLREIELAV